MGRAAHQPPESQHDDRSPGPEISRLPAAPELSPPGLFRKIRRTLVGKPRDVHEKGIFHAISLIPFLAWVGLGADGLSSSSYGPEEAFRTLGAHAYLAVGLAVMTALTIAIISSAYRGIIERFPHGGGGYVVATKLLGRPAGVVSGCALLVDYVLTITVSIAAATDALFSFVPLQYHGFKVPVECTLIAGLTTLNLRGVRESATALMPIFVLFVVTHVALIVGGIVVKLPELPATSAAVSSGFSHGLTTLGGMGMLLLFLHAYSLGGGTYTGLEAVSNGLPIMRAPQVQTAKRTMTYMAVSLAFTAGGLIVCYLLWRVAPVEGKTLNAVLTEKVTQGLPLGGALVAISLFAEGALLVVGAQAGFIDGPRVLANMANDSWMPRRFAALSDRLTTQNGILLMGLSSLAALLYTHGDVGHLVVMYSINVFLTFSLSMFGMARDWWGARRTRPRWRRSLALFVVGFVFCVLILVVTVLEKFSHGGWLTLLVTGILVGLCFLIRGHYRTVQAKVRRLYEEVRPPSVGSRPMAPLPITNRHLPTAVVLVTGYGGLGIHTVLNLFRAFPGHFKNLVFLSAGVIDSGRFKGDEAVEALRSDVEASLQKYRSLAAELGVPSDSRLSLGTDAVEEAEKLCAALMKDFPSVTFFSGKIVFRREAWYQRILHNETATAIQKRLYWLGATMVILPARVP